MLSSEYSLYIKNVLGLVRSMVIKYPCTIFSLNSAMAVGGDVLSLNKTDWKYYRNVSGQRYIGTDTNNVTPSSMSDPLLQVYSIDLNRTIDFTVENLLQNPITLKDLKALGNSYNKLLSNYPDQELLIRGVLSPVDIDLAISSPGFTILSYDPIYVGQKETNLIPKLQEWLYAYFDKWFNMGFYVTDQLYAASFYAVMINAIVLKVIDLRLENCKTDFAHEYHIWNYLGSYFELDKYKGVIDLEQAAWLYRNLEFINANVGTNKVLDFLNNGFAYPFGLQLYGFTISKNQGNSLAALNAGELNKLKQNVYISRYPYGTTNLASESVKEVTPDYLISLLRDSAILNAQNKVQHVQNLIDSVKRTDKQEIPTGVIEANIVPKASALLVNKTQERIKNWFYLASRNHIAYSALLTLPDVSISDIELSAKDAAILLIYASMKIHGNYSDTIPYLQVTEIMTYPTIDGIENGPPMSRSSAVSAIEPKYLSGIVQFATRPIQWDRFNDIQNAQTYPKAIMTRNEFDAYMELVINNKIQHALLPALEPSGIGRGQVSSLINAFYQNYQCVFAQETTFTSFLNRMQLDTTSWSKTTYEYIFDFIFKEFMNVDKAMNGLGDPYISMVKMLRAITSYTITIVPGPVSDNVMILNLDHPGFEPSKLATNRYPVIIPIDLEINPGVNIISNTSKPVKLDLTKQITVPVKTVKPASLKMTVNEMDDRKFKLVTVPVNLVSSLGFDTF